VNTSTGFYTGWLDNPASVRSIDVAIVAVFTSAIVGTDFVLTPFVNIKLMDPLVFVVAFAFGFRRGAAVAVLSELTWSIVSPWGMAGAITPFLVGGELLFAAAGWWAAKVWGAGEVAVVERASYIGALMLACAFIWDLETNTATALLAFWPSITLQNLVVTEALGIPFALVHEAADFFSGALLVPLALVLIPGTMKGRV
jgi:hypothetical protein